MATLSPTYAAPFDAVAEEYDRTFTTSAIGRAQRLSVWKELAKTFCPGDHILEIGCGTGVDACFLGAQGVRVLACDSSPAMLALAQRRARQSDQSRVQLRLLHAENLAALGQGRTFDGAFSNFGALNCLEDLRGVITSLAQLLKPGAIFMLCVMGRYCAWEMFWYLLHVNPDKAFRRVHRGAVTARLAAGTTVLVRYPSVSSLIRMFSPEFRVKHWKGVGITVPPSYLEHLAKRYPRCLRWMSRADSLLENIPVVRGCADHVLLTFERVTEAGDSR